jgi:ribonuclease Z
LTPVLGTASQAPTRARNHNGYFLRWDDEGLLFIMDTRLCDAAFELAEDADLVVCESTFADADAALADDYGHLTAGQAGLIARAAGARRLVLTHFSQRYQDATLLLRDAAAAYDGDIVLAADLDRIPVPPRETAR